MIEPIERALVLMEESFAEFLARLPSLIIALIAFYIVYRLSKPISTLVKKGLKTSKRPESLQTILSRLTQWVIILFGFMLATVIAVPNFDPGELISLLGIGTVAIGFAFRDVLQNFLAGILILLTEPFKINDEIIIGDYEGTVEDIQIRATYLRTYDNRRVVIPNSELFTGSVIVNTAYDKRRSEYVVGIGYEDDIASAQELCLKILRSTEGVLDYPSPDTIMSELGDSSVNFIVRWWTNPRQANVLKLQNTVLRRIKDELVANGFNIPFPIRTVYFNDERTQAQDIIKN